VPQKSRGKSKASRKWRRRWIIAALVLMAWMAVSHLVVRRQLERWLGDAFAGSVRVDWALLRPDLDVVAYGVDIEGEHFRLSAARLRVGLRVWGIFGADPVEDIEVDGLRADADPGERIRMLRDPLAAGADAGEDADLDPFRLPPAEFNDAELRLGGDPVLAVGRLVVRQVGDRSFGISTSPGELARVPFEKMTARLIPRAGHVLLNDLKLRAFNGMVGGVIDIDTNRAGAFNGDIEAHFLEVEDIWRTYGLPYAEKRRGDVSARVVFRGDRPDPAALQGTGSLTLRRARFFSPLSFKILLVLKVPVEAESMLTGGEMKFSFEDSLAYVEEARFNAQSYVLEGRGILSFAGGVDLEVEHAGTTVAVSGQLEDPKVKVLPFSHITLPFERLFRERVRK